MDNLEMAKALFRNNATQNGSQTTTAYGIAVGDSSDGSVMVNLGGDTVSIDDDQTIEVDTTFAVFEGDEVIVSLVGADGTGKAPVVTGVVGRGDQQEAEIKSVTNYVWNDANGLHVSTEERSVQGANILLDSDSLDIRNGNSNSEADQTVYASFGKEVTVGSRRSGYAIGEYSQVYGLLCIATGDYSHAEGLQTRALGNFSHAEGQGSQASVFCHAEGQSAIATGNTAHAEGGATRASGDFSHAEGYHVKASGEYQHVQGKYNVDDANSTYADIVGNGSADNARSNAYNLDWDGNAEFQGEVYVGGCTPNGETPYPVVRYNTSNSKQEYYDKGDSSWKALSGSGGGASWTSLWDNSSPSSSFAAQTVSLDLSGWAFIAIVTKFSTTHDYKTINIIRVGDTCPLDTGNLYSTMYTAKRSAAVSESGITFSTGYRNTTGTSGAEYCIPVAVYGVVASVTGVLKTASGSVIAVSDALAKAVKSLTADINAVQNLNGYDYPWPAGGGKNLFDKSTVVNGLLERNNGSISANGGYYVSDYIPVKEGKTITFTGFNYWYQRYYDANKTLIDTLPVNSCTVTIPSGVYYLRCSLLRTNIDTAQVEYGSTATAYAPYSNICPISGWSNVNVYREAQYDAGATPYATINLNGTVYGGTLDVTTGVLTVDRGYVEYEGSEDESWKFLQPSGYDYTFYITISGKAIRLRSTISNEYENIFSAWASGGVGEYGVFSDHGSYNRLYFRPPNQDVTTVAEWKTWLASNPLQIVYELATPQTIQLTPTQVQMLLGNNALWADSGDSEVQYWAAQ